MGLSPQMMSLAGDVNAVSGGSPEKGAEVNAAMDLVDVNAFRLAKRGIDGITDAIVGTRPFKTSPGGR
jgi:hypothetical protein